MISTQKKLLYGLALLASSSLFAHELVKAMRSESAPLGVERPAEMDGAWTRVSNEHASGAATDRSAPRANADLGAPLAPPMSEAAMGAPRGAEDVLASLERALQRLEGNSALGRSGRAAALDGATRSSRELGAGTVEAPSYAPPTTLRAPDERRDDSAARARLQRFLDEAPLMGTICSASESVALFGGRGVRVGEFLFGGDGRVTACSALGVSVSVEGFDVWVPLPAVRTRSALQQQPSFVPFNPPTPTADTGAPAQ